MKPTGIMRRVDALGRIVLPKELRNHLEIAEKDTLEIFTDGEMIILKKYSPSCIFTDSMENLIEYNGKRISKEAIEELAKKAGII